MNVWKAFSVLLVNRIKRFTAFSKGAFGVHKVSFSCTVMTPWVTKITKMSSMCVRSLERVAKLVVSLFLCSSEMGDVDWVSGVSIIKSCSYDTVFYTFYVSQNTWRYRWLACLLHLPRERVYLKQPCQGCP